MWERNAALINRLVTALRSSGGSPEPVEHRIPSCPIRTAYLRAGVRRVRETTRVEGECTTPGWDCPDCRGHDEVSFIKLTGITG